MPFGYALVSSSQWTFKPASVVVALIRSTDVSAMLTSNLEKITEHGKRADGIVKAMLWESSWEAERSLTTNVPNRADTPLLQENLLSLGLSKRPQSPNGRLEVKKRLRRRFR
jgi:hypothetical protein